jgi:hypothetical protein
VGEVETDRGEKRARWEGGAKRGRRECLSCKESASAWSERSSGQANEAPRPR